MRTTVEAPVSRWMTFTMLPNGSSRCAAVCAHMSYGSPLAVGLPWKSWPYQDASPVCVKPTGPRVISRPVAQPTTPSKPARERTSGARIANDSLRSISRRRRTHPAHLPGEWRFSYTRREMAVTVPTSAAAGSRPPSNHWADRAAERIIRQRGDRERYVVASGVAPSGSVHFGHLREVMSTELVARALRDRGKQVRFIYSWDDYDVFRKVPVNLPRQDELARHLRKPVVDVPDPFGAADSYAAGFEHSLEQVLPRLGIAPEYLYQAQRYRACRYADGVRTALASRAKIREILNRHRERPLSDDYWPITVYSERDGTDDTTVLDWDGADIVTYRDVDGTERQLDLTRSGAAKLLWRVDWPMRWAHEGVDCEPAGKDHHTAGGSFDTGGPIAREVYDYEPPVTFLFGDVGVKGGAGRISSSAGNAVTIKQVLEVYQPEVVRYLYAGTRPNAEFVISFDLDALKIYEDYDQAERIYYGAAEVGARRRARDSRIYEFSQVAAPSPAMPPQVPFRHLCNLIQIRDGDVAATLAALEEELGLTGDEHADARRRLAARAHGAAAWLAEYAPPAMRFRLRRADQPAPELASAEERALGVLYEELAHLERHDGASLANRIYAIAEQAGVEARALFKAAYRVSARRRARAAAGRLHPAQRTRAHRPAAGAVRRPSLHGCWRRGGRSDVVVTRPAGGLAGCPTSSRGLPSHRGYELRRGVAAAVSRPGNGFIVGPRGVR